MSEVADECTGLIYSQDICLWPFKEQLGVRLWQGDVVLNGTLLALDEVRFKFKVKCKRKYMKFWRSSKGCGVLRKGDLHYIHITAPEMAIYTSTVQLKVNEKLLELEVFKVKDWDNWIFDTEDPLVAPAASKPLNCWKTDVTVAAGWQDSAVLKPFDVKCQLLKPLLASSTLGLREYIQGRPGNSIRECLERLVHPVTLEVLSEMGSLVGKKCSQKQQMSLHMGQSNEAGFGPLLEYILLKLSDKLLSEDGPKTSHLKLETTRKNTETQLQNHNNNDSQ